MLHINLKHNENVTDYQQHCQYPAMDMSPSNRADYENITEESNFLLICKMYKHMWEVFDEEMIELTVIDHMFCSGTDDGSIAGVTDCD